MATVKRARYTRRTLLKGAGVTGAAAAAAVPLVGSMTPAAPLARPVAVKVGPPAGSPETALMQVTVNGTLYEVAVDARWTLAEFLRDQLFLTGTKVGCDRGECGSCTVIVDGRAVLACMALATEVAGKSVATVESLAGGGKLNALQQAFWDAGSTQCGFCIPGMLMSATALMAAKPKPTEDEIRTAISGSICRCTGYKNIVAAVQWAAEHQEA